MDDLAALFAQHMGYAKQSPTGYQTRLPPPLEREFRGWAAAHRVPFDVNAAGPTDYDMRGFFQALQRGDPRAMTAVNPNDGRMHYPDYWKTPGHRTFSAESQWAAPGAPNWNAVDQLVLPNGKVVFDERAQP